MQRRALYGRVTSFIDHKRGHDMDITMRRLVVTFASVMMLVLAFAPMSFAGEDGCDDDSCASGGGGGGGDTGSAVGGAQTGFGGAFVASDGTIAVPLALASGSVVLLTLAAVAARRTRRAEL
jgi:hypothetical protein